MDQANLPTNANASSCRCGNALPHTHPTQTREHYTQTRGGRARALAQKRGGRGPARGQARGQGPRTQFNAPTPGEPGGSLVGNSCKFPAPAPKRIYCSPAPFTAPLGSPYPLLVMAYGASRPVHP